MFDPNFLELVCCKKQQKSPNQETGLENRGPLEALNNTKLILNDERGHSYFYDQIGTYNSDPSDVPIPQTRSLVGSFLSVHYSKPALLSIMKWYVCELNYLETNNSI